MDGQKTIVGTWNVSCVAPCGEGEDVSSVHTLLSGVVQVCHELLVGEEDEKVNEQGRQGEGSKRRRSRRGDRTHG